MFLNAITQILDNPVVLVFFGAIVAGIVLFVVLFAVSKIVQMKKDKEYEAVFDAKKKEQEQITEQTEEKKTNQLNK